jgi:hypothetical protein
VLLGVALAKMPRRRVLRTGARHALRTITRRGEPASEIEPLAASVLQPAVELSEEDDALATSANDSRASGMS